MNPCLELGRMNITDLTEGQTRAVVATHLSQGSHNLNNILLYSLFLSKWGHDLLNGHHAVMKKT